MDHTKCLIIGSGPAGYTAAIYAARADLKPVLYEGSQQGGQLTITTEVENFPGYPKGINGTAMMEEIREQTLRFGVDVRAGEIVEVDFSRRPFICKSDNGTVIEAETVIIATGASAKFLGIASETEYHGYGLSACATCDGFFFKGKTVAVVGGGDTAAEDATYLANLCKKVYLIHRRDQMRASKELQKRVFKAPNIEMVWNHVAVEILGEGQQFNKAVTGIRLENTITKEEKTLNVDGVFIAIGHHPNTEIFRNQLELDEEYYIVAKAGASQTSVAGVFAAGDVRDKNYKQAITAAAGGCIAAIDAERFLASL
ncbi:MAG: thioredoxin-disulfide reductase [Bacteroidales bacterium]|jgi:thioredoxin reductase (NADPH)|nr:thioredoxin-disulfide reductase [Bacteroidales bacterium]